MTERFASLMPITQRPDRVFTRGQGSWLYDDQGRAYLDFVQGWAVNCLGHAPPAVAAAIAAQAARLLNCSPAYYSEPMLRLADLLAAHCCSNRVFFANSGAEANEGAIKLARKWGQLRRDGAFEIIVMEHAFHGRTLATMSASDKPGWAHLFEPKVPGFVRVPLNDRAAVEQAITPRTAAVMLEPIQGEAGVLVAADTYLRELRELTRRRGVLLILDEVQTGIGRTGRLFGYQHSGIEPDVVTLGKGLGGGVPLAALLARHEVCCFAPGDQGGTFNGNALVCAAGCAVLEAVTAPGFLDAVVRHGQHLAARLADLAAGLGLGAVRGRGLLRALDLRQPLSASIVEAALERGLLLNAPRPDTLRFLPALTVTEAEIDRMAELLEESFPAAVGASAARAGQPGPRAAPTSVAPRAPRASRRAG